MKTCLMALTLFVMLCNVAMADWAADYAAWKAQPLESRFTVAPQSDQIIALVASAPIASLDQFVKDTTVIVYNEKGIPGVRSRSAECLVQCFVRQLNDAVARGNKESALAIWENVGKVADVFKAPVLASSWPVSGVSWRLASGNVLVKAGFLAQADLDSDLKERLALIPLVFRISLPWLPANLQPTVPEVLAYIRTQSDQAQRLAPFLTFLAGNYANGQLAAKDYATVLKGIIIASVDRMNTMAKDDPARQPLLDAISAVKTSLKQLQEIEGNL